MSRTRDQKPGKEPADEINMPSMQVRGAQVKLPTIEEAERLALEDVKSDAVLAREYAVMMESIYLNKGDLDPINCAPDRRFIKGDREAWVYDHGNIAELVFVR